MASVFKYLVLSPSHIHQLIENGNAIVIFDQKVLKLDAWLAYHPGGDKSILHFVGRDATDEIHAYHSESSKKQMLRYQIGILDEKWKNIIPPIQRASAGKNIQELHVTHRFESESTGMSSGSSSIIIDDKDLPVFRYRLNEGTSPSSSASDSGKEENPPTVETEYQGDFMVNQLTSLDPEVPSNQKPIEEIVISFRELIKKLDSEGLYTCRYSAYIGEVLSIMAVFGITIMFLKLHFYIISAVFLGFAWHQLVFVAHDLGHTAITHSYHIDTLIGMFVANHLGGLSLQWWKRSHNVHHLVTNAPSHDPDIEHLPFLAISPSFLKSIYSTYYERTMPYSALAQKMIPIQAYLYYIVLCFGRFNLYFLSWEYLILNLGPKSNRWHRYFEISGQIFFWYWFGYYILYLHISSFSQRVLFVLISHIVTMPLHVQFTLSHFAMSTKTPNESEPWAMQQLRTTMDVDCPEWMDWFHGGLQFQAVHHLFPRMPRHNLRKASGFIRVWCKEVGVPYEIYGFGECNGKVISRLSEVARQARFLRDCQKRTAEKGEWMRGEWE